MEIPSKESQESWRDEVRQEVKSEMKREEKSRRRRHCLGCLTVYAVILGVPAIFGLVTVAKTGLYEVPVFTNWLYRPLSPLREVRPLIGSDASVVWRQAAAGMNYDVRSGNGTIYFSETDLTTVISESLSATAADLPFAVDRPQIAITRDDMEIAFFVPRNQREVPVIAQVVPKIDAGKLRLDVQRITVGGVKMPGFMTGYVTKLINKIFSDEFSANLPDAVQLRKVETTQDRRLELTIGLSG